MLFYNSRHLKPTSSESVYLIKFTTLLFIGCKEFLFFFFLIVVVCEEKKKVGGKRERRVFFIILLDSLYYFIGLYVKIRIEILGELWNGLIK